jgi:hypothetical protein
MRKLFILGIIFAALCAGQILLLKSLAYSTSTVSWTDVGNPELKAPPMPNFQIGNLEWDVVRYSEAPELTFFREYFRSHCGDLKGIKAGSCISQNLIKKIPKGTPKDEIFFSNFDPEAVFKKHLAGAPGYCVSYAGITATALLSVGIPARFVQLRPADRGGHNIVELWDEEKGWVLFDPFNDGLIEKDGRFLSAVEAFKADRVKRVDAENPGQKKGYLTDYFDERNPVSTTVVYPEPWLYTRVGEKESSVFRGAFVGFGQGFFKFSVLQTILRIGIILCGLVMLLIFFAGIRKYFSSTGDRLH